MQDQSHSSGMKANGRVRIAARRKPLATLSANTRHAQQQQETKQEKPAGGSLHTPAKGAAPPSIAAESPGLLRGFFQFLSPEQKRTATAAGLSAALEAQGSSHSSHSDSNSIQPIPFSMNIEATNEPSMVGTRTSHSLMPLSPQQSSSTIVTVGKSPLSTLLSAMAPVAAVAAAGAGAAGVGGASASASSTPTSTNNAQPRNLAFSFVPPLPAAAAVDIGPCTPTSFQAAALHSILQPYAALLPPAMLQQSATRSTPVGRRPAGRKSESAEAAAAAAAAAAVTSSSVASLSPSPLSFAPSSSTSGSTPSSSRFACGECSKQFPSNSALSMHLLVHSNSKPFVCPHSGCAKAFRQKGHLISHHRKHTGEKPFLCPADGCDKRFKDKSGLNTHVKRQHHGVSTANVTATYAPVGSAAAASASSTDDADMDAALEEAIAQANVTLNALQAEQDRLIGGSSALMPTAAAAAAAGGAGAGAAAMPGAARSRNAPGSVVSSHSKKRSHTSMEAVSPTNNSLRSLTPSTSSCSSAAATAATATAPAAAAAAPLRVSPVSVDAALAGGSEEELERLASSASTGMHPMDSMLCVGGSQQTTTTMTAAMTAAATAAQADTSTTAAIAGSTASVSSDSRDQVLHRLLKRSRSESESPASVLSHKLTLHTASACSFSPIPSPVLASPLRRLLRFHCRCCCRRRL